MDSLSSIKRFALVSLVDSAFVSIKLKNTKFHGFWVSIAGLGLTSFAFQLRQGFSSWVSRLAAGFGGPLRPSLRH